MAPGAGPVSAPSSWGISSSLSLSSEIRYSYQEGLGAEATLRCGRCTNPLFAIYHVFSDKFGHKSSIELLEILKISSPAVIFGCVATMIWKFWDRNRTWILWDIEFQLFRTELYNYELHAGS